ncbi:MAG: sigma factor-like helix-turn-helix DNA-binding protein [Prevotella sp.]|jgi:DNA-directed RNA polymerase sigma subunit (sigma70/sigma32)
MDVLSKQLDSYLTRMGSLHTLHNRKMEGYIRNLLFLLPPGEGDILAEYYGILGTEKLPLEEIARRHGITLEETQRHIEKNLRQIAITPEWQLIGGK